MPIPYKSYLFINIPNYSMDICLIFDRMRIK